MCSTTARHWFLDRLGVERDADERTVRRAYARELKQIDQAADPAGFQSLREAYEQALDWARLVNSGESVEAAITEAVAAVEREHGENKAHFVRHDAPQAEALAPHEAPAPPARAPSPYEMASAVVGELVTGLTGPIRNGRSEVPRLLEQARTDPRLTSVDARHLFEGIVVAGLAAGWRPHHEHLFTAAVDQFDWRADRSRLRSYPPEAAVIDAAIEQQAAFLDQGWMRRRRQLKAIARLRDDTLPSNRYLIKQLPLLDVLEAAWPQWLAVIASEPNLRAWRAQAEAIPRWRRVMTYKSSDKARVPRTARSRRDFWIMVIGLSCGVLWGIVRMFMN
ncbi:hypothetical protein BH09PSE6_BH09PSE6_11550 [soil metagenome]